MRQIALFALTLLVSASAFANPRTCFYGRSVDSFQVRSHDTMDVRDMGRIYRVRLSFCSSLRWADRIAFETFSGSWVCRNDKVLTLDFRGRVMDRCWITDITQVR